MISVSGSAREHELARLVRVPMVWFCARRLLPSLWQTLGLVATASVLLACCSRDAGLSANELAVALGAVAVVGMVAQVFMLGCVRRGALRKVEPTAHRPPISVLRPVCGLDDELEANLDALCSLRYPRYEVIVIAADPADQALPVVRRVRDRHPRVAVRIVIGAPQLGRNRKVSSLIHGSRFACHEWLLISDSNVRPHPNYLERLADEAAAPGVGMVANLIVGEGGRTLGSELENLQLNGYLLPATVAAGLLHDTPCVMGKSMLFRRSDLETLGGFTSVADHLAEDFLLARAFHRSGRRVVISSDPLITVNTTWSFRRFLSRHIRWNQIRCRISPRSYIAEVIATPAVPALAMLVLGLLAHDTRVLAVATGLLIVRVALEVATIRATRPGFRLRPELPGLVILRDVCIAAVWLVAPWKSTVSWRGQRYRIGHDSYIEPLMRRGRARARLRPEAA